MRLSTLIIPALMAVLLAGCGVRGALEPPPAAETPAVPEGAAAPADDRSFILDGLLL